jgi:hypothetical protein
MTIIFSIYNISYIVGVIIFDSVFTYKNNQTKKKLKQKPKLDRNQFKPTGFGSIWLIYKKTGKNYIVFWAVFELSDGLVININIVYFVTRFYNIFNFLTLNIHLSYIISANIVFDMLQAFLILFLE